MLFLIKITAFLYKNAVVLANRCVQNYTHGPPSPHQLARRYTGLPAQYIYIYIYIHISYKSGEEKGKEMHARAANTPTSNNLGSIT